MTPQQLLAALARRGATVAVRGDRLRVEAPQGAVTAELRAALVRHKPALLALVADPAGPPIGVPGNQTPVGPGAIARDAEELLALGRQLGWPTCRFAPHLSMCPGQEAWGAFAETAPRWLPEALVAARRLLSDRGVGPDGPTERA